jgi:DNA-binding response OmpR family regulator
VPHPDAGGDHRIVGARVARGKGGALRVLVIEDDPGIAVLLATLLVYEGHAVTAVAGAAVGLAQARAEPWDACLADGFWEDATSASALAYLADLGACCPVVVLSARVWASAARAADLGVVAVVSKPFDLDELLGALATATSTPAGASSSTSTARSAAAVRSPASAIDQSF